ncbi:hypothetical protein P154DRAFT_424380, partial [Amniculicola lignicola CBS 123094]
VLIYNSFRTYKTLEILEFYFKYSIILCYLPSYTSYKLQLYNIKVFTPLKIAYYNKVKWLNRGGIDRVGKEYFTYLYQLVRDRALTKRNIKARWATTSLFPFNPKRYT